MDNYEGVVLSLGSNIGDREENLRNALVELELVGEINLISSLYESDPLLVTEQRSFYNILIEITYQKTATHLIKNVKIKNRSVIFRISYWFNFKSIFIRLSFCITAKSMGDCPTLFL